jgi:hypothetical protein
VASAIAEPVGLSAGLGALAIGLLASAVGVMRMRTWGVLLGAVTSAATIVAALFASDHAEAFALTVAALPGVLLAATVVAARRAGPSHAAPADVVSASTDSATVDVSEREDALPAVRARVEVVAECHEEESPEAETAAR